MGRLGDMTEIEYLVLFASQIGNAFARAWNISCISSGSKWMAHISWQLYGVVFLISLSLGIKSLMDLDWLGIFLWFIGSGIGQEFAMRLKR